VVAFLRKRGIPLIIYLDDILILNESKIGAEEDFALAASILERCWFLVNNEKSIGVASQRIEYLGLIADSVSLAISLLKKKVGNILRLCKDALILPHLFLRDIVKLLGNFARSYNLFRCLLNWMGGRVERQCGPGPIGLPRIRSVTSISSSYWQPCMPWSRSRAKLRESRYVS
jgi:hypothetical protein